MTHLRIAVADDDLLRLQPIDSHGELALIALSMVAMEATMLSITTRNSVIIPPRPSTVLVLVDGVVMVIRKGRVGLVVRRDWLRVDGGGLCDSGGDGGRLWY
jgi:hypothetical protein